MSMRQLRISKSITSRESPSLEKYLQDIRSELSIEELFTSETENKITTEGEIK